MIGRVTSQTMQQSTLLNLQTNLAAEATLQAQLSSGKKVTRASDDPAHAAQLLSLRGQTARNTQYDRNITDATSWLSTVDDALQTASTNLTRARDLVVQGGDAALSTTAKSALATEISGIKTSLLATANTTFLGRSVFAGTSSTAAYDTSTYAWSGTAGATVQRQVADGTSVQVDSDGRAAFGEGSSSVFSLLDSITATLNAGGDPTSQLTALDGYATGIKTSLASVGARENQVDAASTQLATSTTAMATQTSGIEDIDLAQVILQLQSQDVSYKAALGAASKVLTPSLMEYLT